MIGRLDAKAIFVMGVVLLQAAIIYRTSVKLKSSSHTPEDDKSKILDNVASSSPLPCPPWPLDPPVISTASRPDQVLLFGFHPEKAAGSTIARFLELQEQINGGEFEMMDPFHEDWLLLWLSSPKFRELHPRVFCHLHLNPQVNSVLPFASAQTFIAKAKELGVQDKLQVNDIMGENNGFEYVLRLLATNAPRLEQESNARIVAIPHWREPGDHFVSMLMFLDFAHNGKPVRGLKIHAQNALERYRNGTRNPDMRGYDEPEYLLRYYLGNDSPLVAALHSHPASHTKTIMKKSKSSASLYKSTVYQRDLAFQQAYRHFARLVMDTRKISIWSINERLDEALLLLAERAGFTRIYEEGTCLPLWEILDSNVNKIRKQRSNNDQAEEEEAFVAGLSRKVISPASSSLHPLILKTHDRLWQAGASDRLQPHLDAIRQTRKKYRGSSQEEAIPIPDQVLAQRKTYKAFLQLEKYGTHSNTKVPAPTQPPASYFL